MPGAARRTLVAAFSALATARGGRLSGSVPYSRVGALRPPVDDRRCRSRRARRCPAGVARRGRHPAVYGTRAGRVARRGDTRPPTAHTPGASPGGDKYHAGHGFCRAPPGRCLQPQARRQRPSARVAQPDAGRPLQPRRRRGGDGRAGDGGDSGRPRRPGGPRRTTFDGRRLPERRLRSLEGGAQGGAGLGVGAGRRGVRADLPRRGRSRLRSGYGPHAPAAGRDQPRGLRRAVRGARRRRLHRRGPVHGAGHRRGGRRRPAVRPRRRLHRGARGGAADPGAWPTPAVSPTRRSSR